MIKQVCLVLFFFTAPVLLAKNSFVPAKFSVDIIQSYKSTLTGKIRRSRGKLDYQFPSKIHLYITHPDPSTFVSDSKQSWYYTPPFDPSEKGQVIVQSSGQLYLPLFFDALKNGLKSNKHYTVKLNKNDAELKFSKNMQTKLKISWAKLSFEKSKNGKLTDQDLSQATSLEFKKEDGKSVRLGLENFDSDPKFVKDHFVFQIPPNTSVKTEGNSK